MKLNKKGFTLIELLAVIALLSVLATVSVVVVQSTMKKSNKKIDKIDNDKIKETAGAYIADNFDSIKNSLNTDGCYIITGEKLDSEGYMKLENNKKSLQLIVTKAGDKTLVEYPEEVSLNTSCYDLGTNAVNYMINSKYVLHSESDGVTISAGVLGGDYNIDSLKNIIIPNSVTAINEIGNSSSTCYTTFKSKSLESVILPSGLTTIGKCSFHTNNLTSIKIPNSVTSIGGNAFQSNKLISVEIPDSVTTMGGGVFYDNNLTSVKLSNSVTSIGVSTFYNNKLTSVIIPDSVTYIDNTAFSSNKLNSVSIPSSVISMGTGVFQYNKLTNVTIPPSVTSIGSNTFLHNPLKTIKNKTGRNFNWKSIIGASSCTMTTGTSDSSFITGSCSYTYNYVTSGKNSYPATEGTVTVTITN